jgi:RimJ/RimL family protein N-acetyltransferase
MITLEKNQYATINAMLDIIAGASWHLDYMKNSNLGKVIVDKFPDANTVYLETPFFFYYFAGKYNKIFMEDILNHIINDLIPAGQTRPLFIFSSNQEWKNELENYLSPYMNKDVGPYLVRRLHHLDNEKYKKIRKSIVVPSDPDYIYETQTEGKSICISVKYHGEEIGNYCAGSPGLNYLDFDLFTHPNHRNKGLALFCCARLIDHCLNNNVIPQWGCETANVPSCNLAEKLGFKIIAEEKENFAVITREPA